jgi:hypothetical protein
METRAVDRSAFNLWCPKEREGKYITFINVRIVRQVKDGTWMAVEPGWTVTKTGPVDVRVQQDGRDGVTLPFRVGMMPAKGATWFPAGEAFGCRFEASSIRPM